MRVTAMRSTSEGAPVGGRGRFISDYTGLINVPGTFTTAYSVAGAPDPSTIFCSTIPFVN